MKIVGTDGMSSQEIRTELERGARFVIYQYCITIAIMTFKRPSDIYFIRPGEGAVGKGIGFSLISFVLGWWGIPWGPIYTIQSIWTNSQGGRDVTQQVVASSAAAQLIPQARGF